MLSGLLSELFFTFLTKKNLRQILEKFDEIYKFKDSLRTF